MCVANSRTVYLTPGSLCQRLRICRQSYVLCSILLHATMVLLQAECSALPSSQLQWQGMHSFHCHRCKLVSMSCLDHTGPAFGPQISLQEQSPPSLLLNSALSARQDGFPESGHECATAARPVLAVCEEQSSRCGPQSGRLFS